MHCSASCLATRSIAPVACRVGIYGIAQGTVRGVASFAHEAPVPRGVACTTEEVHLKYM